MRIQLGEIKDYHRIKTEDGEIICKNKVVVSTMDETNQTFVCKVPVAPHNSQSAEFFDESFIQLGMQVLFHLATNKMEGEIITFYDMSTAQDTPLVSEEFQNKTLLNLKKFGSSAEYRTFRDGSFSLTSSGSNIFIDTLNSYVKVMVKIFKMALTGVTFTLSEGLMLFHMIQGTGMRYFTKLALDLKMDKYIKFAFGRETTPLIQGEVGKTDDISIDVLETIKLLVKSKFFNIKMDGMYTEVELYKHKLRISPEEILLEDNKNSRIKINESALTISKGKSGLEMNSHGEVTFMSARDLFIKSKGNTIFETKQDLYTNSVNYYMYHTNLGAYFRNSANIYAQTSIFQDSWFAVKPRDLKTLLDEHARVAAMPHGNGNNGSPTSPPPSASSLPVKNASEMKMVKPVAKTKYVRDINFN